MTDNGTLCNIIIQNFIENLTDYLAAIISIFALFISMQSYRRERRKVNQDIVFEEKIKAYQEIIFQANNGFSFLYDLVDLVQDFDGTIEEWESRFQEICGTYYNITTEYDSLLFRYIIIIPSTIFSQMQELSTILTGFVTSASHCDSEATISSYDKIEEKLNKVIDLVRKDLSVNKLNTGLSKRIK